MNGSDDTDVTGSGEPWSLVGVRVAVVVTVIFGVLQIVGVIVPSGAVAAVAVTWSLVLFVVGSAAFVVAFVVAAGRSRDEVVTLAGVIWLTGVAPPRVARAYRILLVVQVAIALVSAGIRPFTAVAFGVLAPIFGLGSLAWHAARHGTFAPIPTAPPAPKVPLDAEGPVHGATRDAPVPDPPPLLHASSGAADSRSTDDGDRSDPDDFDQLFRRRKRRGRR